MRCKACDTLLNNYESTRKTTDGDYLDLCTLCYNYIRGVVSVDSRADLESEADHVSRNTDLTDIEDLIQ